MRKMCLLSSEQVACRCIPDEKVRCAIELRLSLLSFQRSCTQNRFFASERASFTALFSIDFFVGSKNSSVFKSLQQPLEPFRLKLSLSSMVQRTFSCATRLPQTPQGGEG